MMEEGLDPAAEPRYPPYLRLVWSNPHPPLPKRPVDLAAAIEGHLSGRDGLSDAEFLRVFSGARG